MSSFDNAEPCRPIRLRAVLSAFAPFSARPNPEAGFTLHDRQENPPDLDLPHAPDFVSRRSLISLAEMLPILDERRRMFPFTRAMLDYRRKRRVTAEFEL